MAGTLLFIGYIVYFVGMVWMVVTAVKSGNTTGDKALWGIVSFICGIFGGIAFYVVKKQGLNPLLLEIAGVVLCIIAVVMGGGQASFNFGG